MFTVFIQIVRARFLALPLFKKRLFIIAVLTTLLWPLVMLFVLPASQVDILSQLQIDKIAHFGAGIFLAGLLFISFGDAKKSRYIYFALAVGILWEIWELFFLPDQFRRFRHVFMWWFTDTLFDLVADVLGAYFWVELP